MDCSKVIPVIEPSIAKVFSFDPKLSNTVITGTAFVYGAPEILVTCNHVVNDPGWQEFIKFPDTKPEDIISASVVLRDEEHDIALLKIEDKSRRPIPTYKGKIIEGIEVIFAGYPLDLNELTTHQGVLSSISTDATGNEVYLIDGTVNSGNSGCPLMTHNGEVIGVVSAQRRENKEILEKVNQMYSGAISIQSVDLVDIYKALISNLQLGIGYAIPAGYIPQRKETPDKNIIDKKRNESYAKMIVSKNRS